ncbi:hypothetical protein [Bacillus sp. Marseille-P3661]|uniref:hypothetical protein n=1 Tax=Bacillus sp. Marseille-P3661 TaxID=1936234 RepID=UPI0021556E6A|nr:hypothetical protein [Bacillus sp. Marseille-P3661]
MNQYGQMPITQMPYQQMPGGGMGPQHDLKDFCKKYMHHYVNMQTQDGMQFDGIIDGMDQENVYMLVPDGDEETMDERFGVGFGVPYGYGFPWGYGYGGYPRRFRRFRRHRFPFYSIGGFFFPFFF